MRHGDKIKNLSRTKSHRKALLKNLTIALVKHKGIVTTLAKAKALRIYVEPLLTKTKGITTQELMTSRQRFIFSHLQNEEATKELFTVVAPKIADRPGGYCRIIKMGPRKTDSAEMAYIELVDFNEARLNQQGGGDTEDTKPKAKRTRRSKSSSAKSVDNNDKKVVSTEEPTQTKPSEKEVVDVVETKIETPKNEVTDEQIVVEEKEPPTTQDKQSAKEGDAPKNNDETNKPPADSADTDDAQGKDNTQKEDSKEV